MRALGRAAVEQPQQELPPCEVCGTVALTEVIRPEGIEVRVCVAYAPCIARCKAAGTWCVG